MINQLISALLLIPGFWLGYKFSPQVVDWAQKNPKRSLHFSPTQKTLLWLTIGSLFSNTLIFIYGFIRSIVTMFIIPGWCYTQPDLMTRFGKISSCLHSLPSILVFLIILVIVFKFGNSFISNETTKINKFYVVMILLTIVIVIYQIVQMLYILIIGPG
ncbi:MAG: hypothetical protein CVU41_09520 [Chloroflexi bacterium HGW-Chloroflexi-3]|nr:MAG: hypothetical protein CVU41_09520 [Chloroflexi bacterium HGW-Chloroflexi-3]